MHSASTPAPNGATAGVSGRSRLFYTHCRDTKIRGMGLGLASARCWICQPGRTERVVGRSWRTRLTRRWLRLAEAAGRAGPPRHAMHAQTLPKCLPPPQGVKGNTHTYTTAHQHTLPLASSLHPGHTLSELYFILMFFTLSVKTVVGSLVRQPLHLLMKPKVVFLTSLHRFKAIGTHCTLQGPVIIMKCDC